MSESIAFPPAATTGLTAIVPAYLYQEYQDDDDLQALIAAYNMLAQQYLNWFVEIGLPIYTGTQIAGALLNWVASGLYGLPRPALPYGQIIGIGPVDTFAVNALAINAFVTTGSVDQYAVTDDVYKRVLTWRFFKGDGFQYSTAWLKRRIMRFLLGTNGAAPNIDNTYPVSVAYNGAGGVSVTVTLTVAAGITLQIAQVFHAAILAGVLPTPFQLDFTVTIVNDLGPTGLVNNGGMLGVTSATGWQSSPTSPLALPPGAVWDNGGVAAIVPGATPDPFATPIFFGLITSAQLLALGGGNLPLATPGVGTQQLWNNGGFVWVA